MPKPRQFMIDFPTAHGPSGPALQRECGPHDDATSDIDRLCRLPGRPAVLAVIPARGGSKGLPRKNAMPLCGKPLVAYSIEAALAARLVDRVVVSTDDDAIDAIARSYGPELLVRRPAELAGDQAAIGDVVRHARQEMARRGFHADYTVTLYPTHPFRPHALIDRLTAIGLLEGRNVLTAREIDTAATPFCAAVEGRFVPFGAALRGKWYRPYGNYVGEHVLSGARVYLHVLRGALELVDIDYLEDLYYAEELLKSGLFSSDGR